MVSCVHTTSITNTYNLQEKVKAFFDELAPSYKRKFSDDQPYLQFFFQQRLEIATNQVEWNDKIIFDIGAGTGTLYDYLKQENTSFDYYACDLSEAMLSQSNIPKIYRKAGHFNEVNWPHKKADVIVALGLTSYLSKDDFQVFIDFLEKKLVSGGIAIVSFTNKDSWEVYLKEKIKNWIPQWIIPPNKVFGQKFNILTYNKKDLFFLVNREKISLEKINFIPPVIPFLNILSPMLAVRFSKWMITKGRFFFQDESWSTEYVAFFRNGKKNSPKSISQP